MKGRNTRCICIRLPEVVVFALEAKAKAAGLKTPGEYIKAQLLKATNYIEA